MNIQLNSWGGATQFSYDSMALAGRNLCEAINKSKIYAAKKYGKDFECLYFHDHQFLENDSIYPTEEQTITVQFKNGTFFNIGIISIKTTDWKLKSSDEICDDINRLIDLDPRYDQLPGLESEEEPPELESDNELPELESDNELPELESDDDRMLFELEIDRV